MLGDDFSECQCGHGLAGFEGVRYQKGFGLLSNLFTKALPYLKTFGSYIGKHLLNLGSDVLTDVVKEGKPIKESAKRRLKETASSVTSDGMNKLQALLQNGNGRKRQTGSGKRRKTKRVTNRVIKKKSCPKRKTRRGNKKKTCRKVKRRNNKRAKSSTQSKPYSFLD